MKRINDFLKENKVLKSNSLASALGGKEGTSYWEDYLSPTCVTVYHDTYNDANGNENRDPGESGTMCSETQCIDPCPDA